MYVWKPITFPPEYFARASKKLVAVISGVSQGRHSTEATRPFFTWFQHITSFPLVQMPSLPNDLTALTCSVEPRKNSRLSPAHNRASSSLSGLLCTLSWFHHKFGWWQLYDEWPPQDEGFWKGQVYFSRFLEVFWSRIEGRFTATRNERKPLVWRNKSPLKWLVFSNNPLLHCCSSSLHNHLSFPTDCHILIFHHLPLP